MLSLSASSSIANATARALRRTLLAPTITSSSSSASTTLLSSSLSFQTITAPFCRIFTRQPSSQQQSLAQQRRLFSSIKTTSTTSTTHSSNSKGSLSLEALTQLVETGKIDTICAAFPDHYGRLVGKRFDAEFFLSSVAVGGTHACNYLLVVDMEMNPRDGFESANWSTGFGDYHLVPDLSTIRFASWLDKTALVICDVEDQISHERVAVAPRNILRKQLERSKEVHSAEVLVASELEYYTYRDSFQGARQKGYANLETISSYVEDYHILQGSREEPLNASVRRHLRASGIAVEGTKGEAGRGQHELNVLYSDALQMADTHLLLKQCLKEVADSLGWSVTFMAKPDENDSGSSCHLHLNLVAASGKKKNIFDGRNSPTSEHLDGVACTKEFRWFLGGWMKHLPEMMVFYAPTVNSYKRFQSSSWAPTKIAWSTDNRTAGFRVVGNGSPGLRIECRIPGADCNPYLGFAAAIASGLEGIANRTEPPPPLKGNAYVDSADSASSLPLSLHVAIDNFKNSDFAKRVFGPEVVSHYAHHFQLEWNAYQKTVTDWERKRYFEQI